jgi:inward rectifier potassium channel
MNKPHFRHRNDPIPVRVGSFEFLKSGAKRFDVRDPYHLALTLRWPYFFLLLLAVDLAINIVFAALYALQPGSIANARPGSFVDAFFFSMETLATVGYGAMSPATLYGHIVSAVEIMCGLTFTAIMTGLIFVRFSRPRSKILFADQAVITRNNGQPTLMIRLGNGRLTLLADAHARANALIGERTQEGLRFRRAHELKLDRPHLAVFALTWTLMHEIDDKSPLFGMTARSLADAEISIILSVEARDHALSAQVYDLRSYGAADIVFGMHYQDAVTVDEQGRPHGDLRRLSLLAPDAPLAEAMVAAEAEEA